MDTAILSFLSSSGPMVAYPLIALILFMKNKEIEALKLSVKDLNEAFSAFRLEHERSSVKIASIVRIETALELNNKNASLMAGKIFNKLDEINRNGCAKISSCRT
jgi:hypothetical protein